MKNLLLLLISTLAFSCTSNNNYYKMPIKHWLDSNLNDISSYEPVEFIIIDSANLITLHPWVESDISTLLSTIQRKVDLVSWKINSISDSNAKNTLIKNCEIIKRNIYKKDINSLLQLLELSSYINKNLVYLNKDSILVKSMFEGTEHRIEIEKDRLEDELLKINTSISSISKELKNGQFIYHKLRAKNGFGAMVLSSWVFKLNSGKTFVEKSLKMY